MTKKEKARMEILKAEDEKAELIPAEVIMKLDEGIRAKINKINENLYAGIVDEDKARGMIAGMKETLNIIRSDRRLIRRRMVCSSEYMCGALEAMIHYMDVFADIEERATKGEEDEEGTV